MTRFQQGIKRSFDIIGASAGLFFLLPLSCGIALLLKATCRGPVFFRQQRIGRWGKPFRCIKFRTMSVGAEANGTVTSATDERITPIGKFLRTWKLDELPQLWNVLLGRMSFVGPRPDVPGYADLLEGDDRTILSLRPGITGPASVLFRHEEKILASLQDPVVFNNRIIWPMKVRINRRYLENWSFWKDIGFIVITIIPLLNRMLHLLPPSPRSLDEFEKSRNRFKSD
jgi:lipopolysaccharide/colanic/teichoic acid biosynthesis glycosyltransferase